jgi:hypothetical protein
MLPIEKGTRTTVFFKSVPYTPNKSNIKREFAWYKKGSGRCASRFGNRAKDWAGCLLLASKDKGLEFVNFGGGFKLLGHIRLPSPVKLGLGHIMSQSRALLPPLIQVSTAFEVKLIVTLELAGLANVLLVSGFLGGSVLGADSFVLRLGQAGWNVRV